MKGSIINTIFKIVFNFYYKNANDYVANTMY